MLMIKKNIPNFFTILNLFCGLIAITCLLNLKKDYSKSELNFIFNLPYNWYFFSVFICLGSFFDFIDGYIARLLNVESKTGKELDSLSDMVTFGVAPGLAVYTYLVEFQFFLPQIGLLIPIFSAIRLSKFNSTLQEKKFFIGMPTPAMALFISTTLSSNLLKSAELTALITTTLCFLMISRIKFLSFKNISSLNLIKTSVKLNAIIFIVILSISFILYKTLFKNDFFLIAVTEFLPFILLLYVIVSLINNIIKK